MNKDEAKEKILFIKSEEEYEVIFIYVFGMQ
jgi:hypothetical protein